MSHRESGSVNILWQNFFLFEGDHALVTWWFQLDAKVTVED